MHQDHIHCWAFSVIYSYPNDGRQYNGYAQAKFTSFVFIDVLEGAAGGCIVKTFSKLVSAPGAEVQAHAALQL